MAVLSWFLLQGFCGRDVLKPAFWANHHLPTLFLHPVLHKNKIQNVTPTLSSPSRIPGGWQPHEKTHKAFHWGDCQTWLNRSGSWPGGWNWMSRFLEGSQETEVSHMAIGYRIPLGLQFMSGSQDIMSTHSSLVLRWIGHSGAFWRPCRNVYERKTEKAELCHGQETSKTISGHWGGCLLVLGRGKCNQCLLLS